MDNRQTNDEEINVEEIMRSIRDKIRKDHARIPTHKIESSSRETPQIRSQNLDNELSFLLHNFDITNNDYSISSHRPLIGTVLIRGRKLVHGEVRRYVDPITWKQNMFNINAARVLNDVVNIVDQEMIQLRSAIDDLGSRPG